MRLVTSKYVLTVHNLLPHDRHTPLNAWLSRLIYRTPAICVVHTLRMKDALVSGFGVDPKKIVVVEHGIDRLLPRTEQSRREMRARLALPPQDRVILFFGGIAPYKGLDILLSAYDLLPDKKTTTLLIAGRCKDPNLEKWLGDEIKMRAAASMHILWLGGYIPDEDVPGLFHGADLLAMPYRHIDQSGVIFMALATGLPIVASDVGTLRDYIPSGFGAVVPPLDPQAFAMALSSWLDKAKDEQNIIPPSFATRLYWSRTLAPMLPIYARLTKG